jgi:hypothetical protein
MPAHRGRRSVAGGNPFKDLRIVGPITAVDRRTVEAAYKWLSLLYTAPPEDRVSFVVSTTEKSEDAAVLGWFNGTTIALLVDRIGTNRDLLFVVVVHEMMHQLAFGTASFVAAVTNDLEYTGPAVGACTSEPVVVDAALAHWADGVAPFADDLMEPFIYPDSKMSRCTAAAVIDVRPTWTLLACSTESDCANACVGSTAHLLGYCAGAPVQQPSPPRVSLCPVIPFAMGASAIVITITQCHRHTRKQR